MGPQGFPQRARGRSSLSGQLAQALELALQLLDLPIQLAPLEVDLIQPGARVPGPLLGQKPLALTRRQPLTLRTELAGRGCAFALQFRRAGSQRFDLRLAGAQLNRVLDPSLGQRLELGLHLPLAPLESLQLGLSHRQLEGDLALAHF